MNFTSQDVRLSLVSRALLLALLKRPLDSFSAVSILSREHPKGIRKK
jgi:hypothetical protein